MLFKVHTKFVKQYRLNTVQFRDTRALTNMSQEIGESDGPKSTTKLVLPA
jgi:hypothetical protein